MGKGGCARWLCPWEDSGRKDSRDLLSGTALLSLAGRKSNIPRAFRHSIGCPYCCQNIHMYSRAVKTRTKTCQMLPGTCNAYNSFGYKDYCQATVPSKPIQHGYCQSLHCQSTGLQNFSPSLDLIFSLNRTQHAVSLEYSCTKQPGAHCNGLSWCRFPSPNVPKPGFHQPNVNDDVKSYA